MNERKEAYKLLKEVMLEGGYASLLMRNRWKGATKQEVALMTQLVYGTLQNYRYLRYQWEQMPKKKLPESIGILLDMSVYQLWKLDKIPAYACIHDAVEIAKEIKHGKYAPVVNAILRNLTRNGYRKIEGNETVQLAIRTSHPDWLVELWKHHYGWENTVRICEADLQVKPMVARMNPNRTTKEELLANPLFTSGKLAPWAFYYDGNLLQSKEYQSGKVAIQDEASQMVAHFADPKKGTSILDMCAAPGTKAIQMAQMMQDEGHILCLDIHEHRVQLIQQAIQKQGIHSIEACCMDARKIREFNREFDQVILDAPCSGLGVLAQKPDLKYRILPRDLDEIVMLQQELLDAAANVIKKNGILVYSTCTLNKKENEKQIEAFLKRHENFTLIKERCYLPFEYQTDGFYMAKLIKNQE
ncbi:MAG: 16S rRNA (cytosine(967)-C(5))-methyltransferase RsmB [Erysipelotrichaceae bacterium]|nr:16S rRNA (cytosine(967)-C(5))-methyltransferase RsmB [Erysipelotrichaceae bacterium]